MEGFPLFTCGRIIKPSEDGQAEPDTQVRRPRTTLGEEHMGEPDRDDIDEALERGPVGQYTFGNMVVWEPCPRCKHQWHGLPCEVYPFTFAGGSVPCGCPGPEEEQQ